jgi:hypothetical protein
LLSLLSNIEDGGDTFLWNDGWLSMDYMALYPRDDRNFTKISKQFVGRIKITQFNCNMSIQMTIMPCTKAWRDVSAKC